MTAPIPDDFRREAASLAGIDVSRLVAALDGEPTVSIRLNRPKCEAAGIAVPEGAERVAWDSDGYYLRSRPRFTFDPLLHAGAYYVEEPSSMFVGQALSRIVADGGEPRRVLDLCAAPGGKSLLLRSRMGGGLLVSNEPIARRAAVLAENVAKWGHPDVVVTSEYPAAFARLGAYFDVVAADVPCSGEGMFRKDEGARAEWSLKAVETCAARQREIIRDVWPALREGGWLIYSTCTFNARECEENVAWIASELGAEPVAVATDAAWGVAGDTAGGTLPVAHFFPSMARGEGFFLALLRKTSPAAAAPSKARRAGSALKRSSGYAAWLSSKQDFLFGETSGQGAFAMHASLEGDFAALQAAGLRIVSAGVALTEGGDAKARSAKKQPAPAAALALSTAFSRSAFPECPLGYADAVRYLRGETLASPEGMPRGRVVVSYRSLPLGFANNVGARMNNAFPQAWRIRSTYVPAEAPQLEF